MPFRTRPATPEFHAVSAPVVASDAAKRPRLLRPIRVNSPPTWTVPARAHSGGDFRLSSGSPLANAGDPSVTDKDGSAADIGLFGGPEAP